MTAGRDRGHPGHEVIELDEPGIGLEGALVIDTLVDGQAAGGIRRTSYPSRSALLEEARSLARAMSLKCALADLPAGGAKTVIRQVEGLETEAAYEVVARTVDALDGAYLCGPDIGTGAAELETVRRVTEHVNPRGNEPARRTAQGVLAGIRGVLSAIDDPAGLEGSRFVVQGHGSVGSKVAEGLATAGGEVLVAEVDPDARQAAQAAGHRVIEPAAATSTPCTVFVPCALGGILTRDVAASIPARGICGSANDQLAEATVADVLHQRGVAYAPDLAVNAGAVIEGVLTARHGRTQRVLASLEDRIERIETRVVDLLERSRQEDRSPHTLAVDAARAHLAENAQAPAPTEGGS